MTVVLAKQTVDCCFENEAKKICTCGCCCVANCNFQLKEVERAQQATVRLKILSKSLQDTPRSPGPVPSFCAKRAVFKMCDVRQTRAVSSAVKSGF